MGNTACAQWYVLTAPELQHHGKHLFTNAAERKEKYTELRARFAKDLYPQKKEEDAQMKINRRPIANPEQPSLPQVTFDEHQQQAETSVKHSLKRVFEGDRKQQPRVTFNLKGNKDNDNTHEMKNRDNGKTHEQKTYRENKINNKKITKETNKDQIVQITKKSTGGKKYITKERLDKYLKYIQ